MRSFDDAEVCELEGIYTLCFLEKLINKKDCSLCRDDGLLTLGNVNDQQIDRMPKNIIKIYKDIGEINLNCRLFRHHVQLKQWHI